MKFFSCFQRYERIILLRRKWLPERLRLFTAIHNNRPIAYGGPHVKFRGGPHLPLPRHWQQRILRDWPVQHTARESFSCGPWELSQLQKMLQKPDFDHNQMTFLNFFQTTVKRNIDFFDPRQIYVDQFRPSIFLSCTGLLYGFINKLS